MIPGAKGRESDASLPAGGLREHGSAEQSGIIIPKGHTVIQSPSGGRTLCDKV